MVLRTPTCARIRWHFQQWRSLWQPSLTSANRYNYTHQMTASMTPCVTTAPSYICKPTAVRTSQHYTSNDTLCDDSPVLDLRTLTPTHTTRHLQRHPVCGAATHTTRHLQGLPVWKPAQNRILIFQLFNGMATGARVTGTIWYEHWWSMNTCRRQTGGH